MLIYQVDNGDDNRDKKPSGGVVQTSAASSMSATIANPITFYGNPVISQSGQSGDLYNYYFASYSRGTDGRSNPNQVPWHNLYLDSYIPLRHKSIYDPCPYGYRIPSHGTYNQFAPTATWIQNSYIGGRIYNKGSFFAVLGVRTVAFVGLGRYTYFRASTIGSGAGGYMIEIRNDDNSFMNAFWSISAGGTVRCIEECELLPDATEEETKKVKKSGTGTKPIPQNIPTTTYCRS